MFLSFKNIHQKHLNINTSCSEASDKIVSWSQQRHKPSLLSSSFSLSTDMAAPLKAADLLEEPYLNEQNPEVLRGNPQELHSHRGNLPYLQGGAGL